MVYKLLIFVLLILGCDNAKSSKKVIKDDCQKEIFDNLEEALANKVCVKKLYLRNQKFKKIPSEIFEFHNLEELDLGANLLTFLPSEVSRLKKLKELALSYNLIDSIGNGIQGLKELETLSLLDNKLRKMPSEFCELTALTELNLNGNPLIDIPNCIFLGSNIEVIYIESITDEKIISDKRKNNLLSLNPNCEIFN